MVNYEQDLEAVFKKLAEPIDTFLWEVQLQNSKVTNLSLWAVKVTVIMESLHNFYHSTVNLINQPLVTDVRRVGYEYILNEFEEAMSNVKENETNLKAKINQYELVVKHMQTFDLNDKVVHFYEVQQELYKVKVMFDALYKLVEYSEDKITEYL